MKHEIKLTGSQLSQVLGITGQAVSGLEKRGRLIRDEVGLYDLKNPENKKYVEGRGIDIKKIQIPETPAPGRPVVNRPAGKIKTPANNKSRSELTEENLILKNEKLRLEIAKKNKELLPTQLVEDLYITYLEKFNSTIERLAGTYIRDIGKDILEAGEVQPKHITRFINNVLEITHNNKIAVQKLFTQYTPE